MRKFSPLRLMTSHTHLYAKLEEFGKDYNVATTNRVADECQYLNMHHRPTAPFCTELPSRGNRAVGTYKAMDTIASLITQEKVERGRAP